MPVVETREPQAVQYAFGRQHLFVLEAPGKVSGIGQTVTYFASYQRFKLAVGRGTIPASVRWVMYDNERWKQTPPVEQKDPKRYMTLFASLAHRRGYQVILAPAQDLAFGHKASGFHTTGTAWQRYISMGLAAAAARTANIYEIQAQSDESPANGGPEAYVDFVRAAVNQARAANPHITIFAGVSTKRVVSASQLYRDFQQTRSLVAGYWLNIPRPDNAGEETLAARFLRELPAAVAADGRSC